MRDWVLRGDWEIGSVLPSENTLADDFGVSTGTMRKALAKLESIGLVSRHAGRGTFIKDWKKQSALATDRFREGPRSLSVVSSTYLGCERIAATSELATRLGVESAEPLLKLARVEKRMGGVGIYEVIIVCASEFEGIPTPGDRPRAIAEVLEGERVLLASTCTEAIHIGAADPDVATHLTVAEGTPLLIIDITIFDADDRPMELRHRQVALAGASYETLLRMR